MKAYAYACIAAFLLSSILVNGLKLLALKWRLFDLPSERKIHQIPVPRIGGLGIVLSYLVVSDADMPLMLGGSAAALLGGFDDVLGLSYRHKLFWQTLIGLMAASISIPPMSVKFAFGTLYLGWLALPLVALWFVILMNAVNLIDGLDGLCSSIALTILTALFVVNFDFNVAVLMAAVMGFLIYNYHPANIFLGDGGSYFLGFMLAYFSLQMFTSSGELDVMPAIFVLGLPLFELGFSIARRWFHRKPIFAADQGHTHHQLLRRGLLPVAAMWILVMAQIASCSLGLSIYLKDPGLIRLGCLLGLALMPIGYLQAVYLKDL